MTKEEGEEREKKNDEQPDFFPSHIFDPSLLLEMCNRWWRSNGGEKGGEREEKYRGFTRHCVCESENEDRTEQKEKKNKSSGHLISIAADLFALYLPMRRK